jgi:hypothetical protein
MYYNYDKDLYKSSTKFNEILHYNLSKLIDSLCHPSLEERVTSVQSPNVYNNFINNMLDKLETHNHITKSEKLELTNLNNNLMKTHSSTPVFSMEKAEKNKYKTSNKENNKNKNVKTQNTKERKEDMSTWKSIKYDNRPLY